jgi:hypothetical protein
MRRGEYIETRDGQWSRWRQRARQRLDLTVAQTLRGKGSIRESEKLQFQRQVLAVLASRGRRAFRSPVVVDFTFTTNQADPPAIHTLPKNYLDLLQEPVDGLDTDRARLILTDDRQVAVLLVHYQLGATPSINITADSLRNFEDDLGLLQRIHDHDFKEARFSRRSYAEDAERELVRELQKEERSSQYRTDELISEINQHIRQRVYWTERFGNEIWQDQYEHLVTRWQRQYLRGTERFVRSIVMGILARQDMTWLPKESSDEMLQQQRDFLFTHSASLDLGVAPRKPGDGAAFQAGVKAALRLFVEQYPWSAPLRTLLSVTILYVPPVAGATSASEEGKDLDNLARTIIPHIHDILSPPATFLRTVRPRSAGIAGLDEFWAEQIKNEKRFPRVSITRYEVVRLPTFSNDPRSGQVRLAFGDGLHLPSIRDDLRDILKKWEEVVFK